jgi:molybdopterin/thiamine biosynthesis adenylyltransferase
MSHVMGYDYDEAFCRNLGFLSAEEQQRLKTACVAIAGLGGTGGAQVLALARMGVGRFSLADPDTFELANFNRQNGATVSNLGRAKSEVARETILDINPEARIRLTGALSTTSVAEFLDGADVVIDSLDFYCFAERKLLYREARARGLWVMTAPPLGFGFTLLMYDPDGMRYEDYFGFHDGMSERDHVVAQIAGIAPKPYMLAYLDRSRPQVAGRRLPSVGAAPLMIAGVIATEVTRLLAGKGSPQAVPVICQYDAMARRFRQRTYRWGMRSPLQRIKRFMLNRMLPD